MTMKRQFEEEYNQRLQLERQVSKFKDDLDEMRKKLEETSRDRDRKGKQLDIVSSEKGQLERFRSVQIFVQVFEGVCYYFIVVII